MGTGAINHVILDIETRKPDHDRLAKELRWGVKPHPGTKDEGKKAAQVAAKTKKAEEGGALSDASPITCIGLRYLGQSWIFTAFPVAQEDVKQFAALGAMVIHGGEEYDMLVSVSEFCRQIIESSQSPLVVAGHNIFGFDLPKLRLAYAQIGLYIQAMFYYPDGVPARDTMEEFSRFFLTRNTGGFVSVPEAADWLNIEYTNTADGAELPALYESGQFAKIVEKNAIDLIIEEQIFKRISSIGGTR
jgi:hypothetical protein